MRRALLVVKDSIHLDSIKLLKSVNPGVNQNMRAGSKVPGSRSGDSKGTRAGRRLAKRRYVLELVFHLECSHGFPEVLNIDLRCRVACTLTVIIALRVLQKWNCGLMISPYKNA